MLARHAHRALRAGDASPGVAPAVGDLARSVWELAAAYDDPERADDARELAASAAATPRRTRSARASARPPST